MKPSRLLIAGRHDTDDIFEVMGSKVKVTANSLQKMYFWWIHTNQHWRWSGFAVYFCWRWRHRY